MPLRGSTILATSEAAMSPGPAGTCAFLQMCRSLARCDRGNVVIIFALLLLPLAGLAGMAIDYGRALSLGARLQSASDAAALAVSEAYSADPSQSESGLRTVAQNYVNAALPSVGAQITDFHVCTTSINDCTDNSNAMQS